MSLYKICNDLRLMGSGPRAGLAEINIPDLQPGSSIMPGKVNPVLPEVSARSRPGHRQRRDRRIRRRGRQLRAERDDPGHRLEPAGIGPTCCAAARARLAQECVAGITANGDRLRQYAESSPSIVTALNPYIGYEAAAQVAHEALETGATIREVVLSRGFVDDGKLTLAQLDRALDVLAMTRPPGSAG